jgi:hypothetical protein
MNTIAVPMIRGRHHPAYPDRIACQRGGVWRLPDAFANDSIEWWGQMRREVLLSRRHSCRNLPPCVTSDEPQMAKNTIKRATIVNTTIVDPTHRGTRRSSNHATTGSRVIARTTATRTTAIRDASL